MRRDPLPVRERTRRAVRGELAQLAADLFVEKGYDETTIDDLAAAAGMSKRTFFRYFASKEELVMGKYEFFGQQLAEDLAARPAANPSGCRCGRSSGGSPIMSRTMPAGLSRSPWRRSSETIRRSMPATSNGCRGCR